jgi:hypothetical protein
LTYGLEVCRLSDGLRAVEHIEEAEKEISAISFCRELDDGGT